MKYLGLIAVFAFVTVYGEECALNMQGVQKIAMECATHDFSLMVQLGEMMENTDTKARSKFVCNHVPQLTSLVMCMVKKLEKCVPPEAKPLMVAAIPKKQRIIDALNFMCEDQSVMSNECMATNIMDITQCYQQKVQQVASGFSPSDDPVKMVCTVIHAEEKCFKDHQGTCSDYYISRLVGAMERLFPKSVCGDSVDTKNDATKTILNSILIHGAPIGGSLKYKPYNVVNV